MKVLDELYCYDDIKGLRRVRILDISHSFSIDGKEYKKNICYRIEKISENPAHNIIWPKDIDDPRSPSGWFTSVKLLKEVKLKALNKFKSEVDKAIKRVEDLK